MTASPKRFAPPPLRWPGQTAGPVGVAAPAIQRQAVFGALREGRTERASAGDELMRLGDQFLVSTAGRNLRVKPNGTYNFVRVQGDTRNDAHTFVSANSGHAGLAAGRPVLYAGTLRFDSGALEWWSNYSGTYQPIAAFRQQAQLPDERFIPWQKLQMGGVGLQRGMLSDQRASTAPAKPERAASPKPAPVKAEPAKPAASQPATKPAAATPGAPAGKAR